MVYMGSKNRIAKHILPIMTEVADEHEIKKWIEPFVGGANLIDKVPDRFERNGYDINPHTISALIAIRDCIDILPSQVSEGDYNEMIGMDETPISSLIRFGCSFGGKFESGYARGKDHYGNPRNYWEETVRNSIKQSPRISTVNFKTLGYHYINETDSLIYCDPPYQGVSGYKTDIFDHDRFFEWCRLMAKDNIVFVSEYNAPDDFIEVWRGEQKTNFASGRKSPTHNAIEKLYRVNP